MASCEGLQFFNPLCQTKSAASAVVGEAIDNMATAVMEAFGKTIASLGTVWMYVGTPDLTGGKSSAITAGASAPNSANITTVLGYVTWISLAIAILSLVILGAMLATKARAGEGIAAVGTLGLVLASVVFISGASALITGLMPSGPNNVGGATLFLQSSLWWYMGAAAIASVIIGGARMAWEQRAEPGRETVKSLLTLVVVAGSGVTIVSLLVAAADSFSIWILNGSLECDVAANSACFGEGISGLLALTTNNVVGGLGALLIILLGLIATLAGMLQILLMVARGGMLVILTGILPLSASFTNTEMGKSWFKKCISWLVAFILYKPAAAIVYAAAFQLVGQGTFEDDGSGLLAVLTGLMLMIIALFAMPALMRFVTPLVGATAGGAGGGALAAGALAALPSGAGELGRFASKLGSESSGSTPGASGPPGSQGPSGGGTGGNPAPSSTTPPNPQQPASSGTAGGGQSAAATSGAGTGAGAGAGASAGAGAGAGAGAAAGGGAAAAGAAAGPVGIAAGAALDVAAKAGQAAVRATKTMAEESIGEGGGPDGSR